MTVTIVLRVAASPAPDITIYRPHPDVPGTTQIVSDSVIGVSVLGVNNGFTSYIVSDVESFVAVGNSFTTQTILTAPTTVTGKYRTASFSFRIYNLFFFFACSYHRGKR